MELNGKAYMLAHIVLFITYCFHQADKIHISNFKSIDNSKNNWELKSFACLFSSFFNIAYLTINLQKLIFNNKC